MKLLLLFGLLAIVTAAQAEDECFSPDKNLAKIEAMSSCYDAASFAVECGAGSTLDLPLVDAAIRKCEAGFGGRSKLSNADKSLLTSMEKRCEKAWGKLSGSLARSSGAYCRLDAVEFIHDVNNAGL